LSINGKKRFLALVAALLLLCGALVPAIAEGGSDEAADKLYAAIDESGYAYVTAAEATIAAFVNLRILLCIFGSPCAFVLGLFFAKIAKLYLDFLRFYGKIILEDKLKKHLIFWR